MNNLILRIITALVGVVIIIGSIFIDPRMFAAVFALISILTQFEFIRTIARHDHRSHQFSAVISLIAGIFILCLFHPVLSSCLLDAMYWLLLIVPVFLITELFAKRETPFQHVGLMLLGLLYIPTVFGLYIGRSLQPEQGEWFALGVLLMVWSNDTFAYFAGRWMGRRKLFERISPKKTWEGFAGGLVMTVACGFCMSLFYTEGPGTVAWMGLGLVVSIAGTFGDLVESMLKRSIHIKDSGSLLPGHGGFLDRFDGFLFAVPAAVCYLELAL